MAGFQILRAGSIKRPNQEAAKKAHQTYQVGQRVKNPIKGKMVKIMQNDYLMKSMERETGKQDPEVNITNYGNMAIEVMIKNLGGSHYA